MVPLKSYYYAMVLLIEQETISQKHGYHICSLAWMDHHGYTQKEKIRMATKAITGEI
jgi:hypothetical protein